jgi:hypothetical protein
MTLLYNDVSIIWSVIIHFKYCGEAMGIDDVYNCYHKTYSYAQYTCKQRVAWVLSLNMAHDQMAKWSNLQWILLIPHIDNCQYDCQQRLSYFWLEFGRGPVSILARTLTIEPASSREFFNFFRQMQGYLKLGHDCLFPHPVHWSPYHSMLCSLLLTMSLHNPYIK